MTEYPALYRDKDGEEAVVIRDDGRSLQMTVRGVEFASTGFGSFDSFEPPPAAAGSEMVAFTIDQWNRLVAATLTLDLPLPVVMDGKPRAATLTVRVELEGVQPERDWLRDWADVRLCLMFEGREYSSRGGAGCFEDELLDIQRQLPLGVFMQCCFNCVFSGYNPYGNGLWGMSCHRNHKQAYLTASTKSEWITLDSSAAEMVREVHLCPEFERWNGQTGYRTRL